MAIVHIINEITMTANTITTLCSNRRMVGTIGMANGTISHHRELIIMAA
jgi:hypothetical protein